jgi:hypothetical protein
MVWQLRTTIRYQGKYEHFKKIKEIQSNANSYIVFGLCLLQGTEVLSF